jgi:hypothetical protein
MADEAFALSPISARAAQPSEADYDAIQEAFMETSRGRWFLGEYAKRNRNSDTRMVLDAVARIEETLAASRKPVRDPLLDQALESLRTALTQAREAADTAVADLALEQNLAPVRKGVRIIREISWRWREIGGDSRICDLIDSQIGAMEAATEKMAPDELARALSGAFDQIEQKIATFDASEAASTPPPGAAATPPQAADAPAAMASAQVHAEQPAEAARASPMPAAEPAPKAAVAESEPHDAFDANDEAMLDMVAMEMAAPDTDVAYYDPKLDGAPVDEEHAHAGQADGLNADEPRLEIAPYEIDVTFPEDTTGDARPAPTTASALPVVTPLQSTPAPPSEPITVTVPEPEPEPSLGSSLIANGIVPRPRASRPDPLAPIRRMSQTEKIAFFS